MENTGWFQTPLPKTKQAHHSSWFSPRVFSPMHLLKQPLDFYSCSSFGYNSLHIQRITYCLCIMQSPWVLFLSVLTPAAKRKIGSNNPLLVPKLLHWMNTSCLPLSDWSLWSLYPTGVQKNSAAQRGLKIGIRLRFTGKPKLPCVSADAILPFKTDTDSIFNSGSVLKGCHNEKSIIYFLKKICIVYILCRILGYVKLAHAEQQSKEKWGGGKQDLSYDTLIDV